MSQLRPALRRLRQEHIPAVLIHHQRAIRWLILFISLAASSALVIHLHFFVTADTSSRATEQSPTLDTVKLDHVLRVIEGRHRSRESGLSVRADLDLAPPTPSPLH